MPLKTLLGFAVALVCFATISMKIEAQNELLKTLFLPE